MQAAQPGAVVDVTADQVREYIKDHDESEYQLIDVRQPEEYQQGHIPGARLMPLSEFQQRLGDLEQMAGKKAVFYCRSGGRSARAAAWASQMFGMSEVYNLLGGMMGWNGVQVPDFPKVAALDLSGGLESLLRQALDLEKGTHQLYQLLAAEYASGPVAEAVLQLARAEVAHGQAVHRLLSQVAQGTLADFETMFAEAPGALVESGESYTAVVARARSLEGQGAAAVLEFALDVELNAYDLYKTLAARSSSQDAEKALLELAQQEKRHADSLLRALGGLAGVS